MSNIDRYALLLNYMNRKRAYKEENINFVTYVFILLVSFTANCKSNT